MTAPQDSTAISSTVLAQDAARTKLTEQMIAMARNAVFAFDGWYDTAAITDWTAGLASRIETLQNRLATSSDAYLARLASLTLGSPQRPVGAAKVDQLRNGITHPGAYGRVADVYRWQQSRFDQVAKTIITATDLNALPAPDLITPVDAALDRAGSVADLDSLLTVRAQSLKVMTSDKRITNWRRVIHPELSKGGTCGLCIAASDRLYGKTEPLPIHALCKCSTMQVYNHADPGSVLNGMDLTKLYKDAGGTAAAKLKATRYQVDEHGELGPVLSRDGQPFRNARTAAGDTNKTQRAKSPEERRAALQRVFGQQSSALSKVQDLAAGDPKWNDYLHKLEARVSHLSDQLAA